MGKKRKRPPPPCLQLLVLLLLLLCNCSIFLPGALAQQKGPIDSRPCDPRDAQALQAFARGLYFSGPTSDWLARADRANTSCCLLPGVTCDGHNRNNGSAPLSNSTARVFGLALSGAGIRGGIAESLANLTALTRLDLSNNSLKGAVPLGLFRLPNLAILDLSGNQLADIDNASPPAGVNMPSLRVLNISNNNFAGEFPYILFLLNSSSHLETFDASWNKFHGTVDASALCLAHPALRSLHLSSNNLSGEIPIGFSRCRALQELALDGNAFTGNLPDDIFTLASLKKLQLQINQLTGRLSPAVRNLTTLVLLDLSQNAFTGSIPDAFKGLRKLESLSASTNSFNGSLPPSLSRLSSLRVLNLRNNSLIGILASAIDFSALPRLISVDLGSNHFTGPIPATLSRCAELRSLNLAKNNLIGPIPESFSNLTSITYLSLSKNNLTGLANSLRTVQSLPNLTGLVLTVNFRGEPMPTNGDVVPGFRNLELLVIAYCGLTGVVPTWIARCPRLQLVDLSWNHLTGSIPPWFGDLSSLFYLDLSNNSFSGEIPLPLTSIKALTATGGASPGQKSSMDFPFFTRGNYSQKVLQYNQISSFPPTLDLSDNELTGTVPPQLGNLQKLHVLDLSANRLSGEIPAELSGMASLEVLDFSRNNLTGRIPSSLDNLTFLARFDVSYNQLSGMIPDGRQFDTFPNSSFVGNPGLCGEHFVVSCKRPTDRPAEWTSAGEGGSKKKRRGTVIAMSFGVAGSVAMLVALVYAAATRCPRGKIEDAEKVAAVNSDDEDCDEEMGDKGRGGFTDFCGSSLVMFETAVANDDEGADGDGNAVSGVPVSELTMEDILRSTGNFDQANIIGCGGCGLVYRARLPSGQEVAIKRLSSGDSDQVEREFRAEVETLSSARHENLVPLLGYCSSGVGSRLLIYAYMENGSLDYWLHERTDGRAALGWAERLRVACGAARGLAYLHGSCQPQILHRDIKSSNILLDVRFEAKLADFGLARLIRPYDTHVTTDLVGTLGYIPPEYGHSAVATFRGDVYSFGIVVLELLTGRRPVDVCRPKERELVAWVGRMRKEAREMEVFDPVIVEEGSTNGRELKRTLEIACLCASESPKARPTIHQVLAWLDDVAARQTNKLKVGEECT